MLYSSHARACLLGEHCDWAGLGASLVLPLPLTLTVQVRSSDWGLVVHSQLGVTRVAAGGACLPNDPNRYVVAAARTLARHGIKLPPARAVLRSQIPMGRGLSSSAAVCVASVRALAAHAGITLADAQVIDLAYETEAVDLGVPCGRMDHQACATDSPLLISWPSGQARRVDRSPLVLVASLPNPVPAGPILATLRARANTPPVRAALELWGTLAQQGAEQLKAGDLAGLGAAMTRAQQAMERIPEIKGPQISALCRELLGRGALGAKFMGAGADRSLIALFEQRSELESAAQALKGQGLETVTT